MTTVLITGGTGFMGSHVVEHIYHRYPRYKLIVLDLLTYAGNANNIPREISKDPRFSFWYGDVCNHQIVNALTKKADIIVHLAAESHTARSIYDSTACFETNVIGTQVVANAVLEHWKTVKRFVYISSSEVYGSAEKSPMDESHLLNPTTPYASSKAGADRLVFSYWFTHKIPAVIIRPFNNYGPRQHLEKLIPRFIASALLNEPLVVHGRGTATRDWVYVRDFCEAVDAAMHRPGLDGEAINVGTGEEHSVQQIARMVLDRVPGSTSEIRRIPDRPGQVDRHISSTAKARKLLGWKARTAFPDGLQKTIQWYRQNREWWKDQLWLRTIPIATKQGRVERY